MSDLHVGDEIYCHDEDDLVDTMTQLAEFGVQTDADYSGALPKLIVTKTW